MTSVFIISPIAYKKSQLSLVAFCLSNLYFPAFSSTKSLLRTCPQFQQIVHYSMTSDICMFPSFWSSYCPTQQYTCWYHIPSLILGCAFSRSVMSDSCNPIDYSLRGSSVPGILQARILEWVAISFSWGSSWPRDWTWFSCTGRQTLYHWAVREAQAIGQRPIKSADGIKLISWL